MNSPEKRRSLSDIFNDDIQYDRLRIQTAIAKFGMDITVAKPTPIGESERKEKRSIREDLAASMLSMTFDTVNYLLKHNMGPSEILDIGGRKETTQGWGTVDTYKAGKQVPVWHIYHRYQAPTRQGNTVPRIGVPSITDHRHNPYNQSPQLNVKTLSVDVAGSLYGNMEELTRTEDILRWTITDNTAFANAHLDGVFDWNIEGWRDQLRLFVLRQFNPNTLSLPPLQEG